MWAILEEVEKKYEEIGSQLASTEVANDVQLLKKLSKEHKDLSEIVNTFREYKKVKSEIESNKEIISSGDDDLAELAKEELTELQERQEKLEEQLKILLLPKDPNDEKNVILEIRAGAGGEEAALFAAELFRLYNRYAEQRHWKVEIMSISEAASGGYKEVIATISGESVYSRLKYERGVHRVQRVPVTETQGRVHTSTVTVAVLPEAEDVDIEILEKDIRVDVYRAGGPGGQCVNTTDSAVRITHIPTGIVVAIQDEKSQHKNKDKALKLLRSRLLEKKQEEADAERRNDRRSQVGTGDRSEKIRTYNFPQSRITDHRIGLSVHSIDQVMAGDLDQLIEPLMAYFQAEALKSSNAGE